MISGMKFVQARYYTKTSGRQIDLIVIHDMETDERFDTAENVARWFAGPTSAEASAHYNIDADSIVQSVRDRDVAWHAPGANHNGIGLEHAGRARQTRAEWLDPYGRKMLRRSAKLTARLCKKYDIPIKHLNVTALRAGARGIVGHWDVSRAFGRSSHYDPGPNFPWDVYLRLVREASAPVHKRVYRYVWRRGIPYIEA